MSDGLKQLGERIYRFRYVMIVALAGLVLLLWPSDLRENTETRRETDEEFRIAAALTEIEGVGQARVLLSEEGAVVVCPGAESPSVCLRVTQAVRCYTGLRADEVMVFKSESTWRDEQ